MTNRLGRLPALVMLVAGVLGLPPLGCAAFRASESGGDSPADAGADPSAVDARPPLPPAPPRLPDGGLLPGDAGTTELLHLALDTLSGCRALLLVGTDTTISAIKGKVDGGCRVCVTSASPAFGVSVAVQVAADEAAVTATVIVRPGGQGTAPRGFHAIFTTADQKPPAVPLGPMAPDWAELTVPRTTGAPPISLHLLADAPPLSGGALSCFEVDEIVVRRVP